MEPDTGVGANEGLLEVVADIFARRPKDNPDEQQVKRCGKWEVLCKEKSSAWWFKRCTVNTAATSRHTEASTPLARAEGTASTHLHTPTAHVSRRAVFPLPKDTADTGFGGDGE